MYFYILFHVFFTKYFFFHVVKKKPTTYRPTKLPKILSYKIGVFLFCKKIMQPILLKKK